MEESVGASLLALGRDDPVPERQLVIVSRSVLILGEPAGSDCAVAAAIAPKMLCFFVSSFLSAAANKI